MRENAAMHGGAGEHRPSAAALIPIAIVAAVVLVIALLVSGGRAGTIVVQSITERYVGAQIAGPKQISITTVTETGGSGALEHLFITDTLVRGYEAVLGYTSTQRYIASENTVYEFSTSQLDDAEVRLTGIRPPTSEKVLAAYSGAGLAPGRISLFKRLLDRHIYRIAGHTMLDGRPALKLAPLPGEGTLSSAASTGIHQLLGTTYVTPGSDDPIAENITGFQRIDWTTYKVLPDTATNRRLLSLTARHPGAHVSHNAIAYLRAVRSRRKR